VVAAVPWARHGAGFTRALEDTAAWLVVHTSRVAVAELLRVAWRTVGRMLTRVAAETGQDIDRLEGCAASAAMSSPTARGTAT
jgi:transposase